MRIIIGLGNPSEKYKNTRHNVGFMAIDALAKQLGLIWQFNKKFNAKIAMQTPPFNKGGVGGFKSNNTILLIKPHTYMNNSGQAVQAVLSYYKLLPKKLGLIKQKNSDLSETLIVIHDDIDIELGKYKIATDSRAAGHNGVQSIIDHLKTKKFKRIRIGVKTESLKKIPADKFVLQNFIGKELNIVKKLIGEIVSSVLPDAH